MRRDPLIIYSNTRKNAVRCDESPTNVLVPTTPFRETSQLQRVHGSLHGYACVLCHPLQPVHPLHMRAASHHSVKDFTSLTAGAEESDYNAGEGGRMQNDLIYLH
jgi:hypothetical protein